jgi:hypothetical protein
MVYAERASLAGPGLAIPDAAVAVSLAEARLRAAGDPSVWRRTESPMEVFLMATCSSAASMRWIGPPGSSRPLQPESPTSVQPLSQTVRQGWKKPLKAGGCYSAASMTSVASAPNQPWSDPPKSTQRFTAQGSRCPSRRSGCPCQRSPRLPSAGRGGAPSPPRRRTARPHR